MKNKLLKKLLLPIVMLCGSFIYAQTVSGTVSDETGPLPGVNIIVKGTSTGTQSDFDGNYSLEITDPNAVLVFSFIGYTTQEIPVNGQSTINVTLSEDASELDEVVVIGYGSTTVRDATGAVSAVTSEEFNGGVIASPEQLIQGKTAGVNIQQTSGEPGAGIQINIRGSKSVRGENNPLFVVDGIPLSGGNITPDADTGDGGSGTRNPLTFLNPNDIESISILKDASATAIYGSRGANGVVIITTKSGAKGGGGVFDFTSTLSISSPANEYDLLDRTQFLNGVTAFGGDAEAVDFGANTDWQDYITRTAVSHNQNLSYSYNYGSGNVRATLGYADQYGVIKKSDLERLTGRLNFSQNLLDDKLKIGFQGTISRVNDQQAPLSGGAGFRGDILGASYSANPTWPIDPDFTDGGTQLLPANYLAYSQILGETDRYLVGGSAEYAFTEGLSVKVNGGYDKSEGETTGVLSGDIQNITGIEGNGFGTYRKLERESKLLEATVNYNKDFGDSNLDLLVGYSFQDFRVYGFNSAARGFFTRDLDGMAIALRNSVNSAADAVAGDYQQFYYANNTNSLIVNRLLPTVVAGEQIPYTFQREVRSLFSDGYDNTDELQSYFARANYSLNNKYLFTATIRADGSSRFAPDNQYGYFPSGAFAWKMNEEGFFGDGVSTMKLRLSAGITGSQDGLGYGNFVARQRFGGLGIQNNFEINQVGLAIVATDVPDLKWEETFNMNVGLDFGFNNDRLSGSIDVYRDKTTDVLLRTPPAAPAVDPFQFGNVDAAIINQGIEFALNYDFVNSEDFSFSAGFNIAYNDNEIQDFAGIIDTGEINGQGLSGAFAQRFTSGVSLYSYYMAVFEGFDADGFPIYADIDGNGVGDPSLDKQFVGEDALPDVTGGLNLNFRYKNFDASAFFNGQAGFSVYNNTANGFFTSGSITNARNVTEDVLTSGEGPGASADVSTRFLEKGDFIRFQNASIGYNVPLSGEGVFKSLRFSITGQNLFLITNYSGLDPEVTVATGDLGSGVPTRGIDWSAYPNPRTFTFGLNAKF